MDRFVQVEHQPDFIRDMETGAILNINTDNIRKQKMILQQRRQEKQEIDHLKNEMSEIKSLLQQLLENK